MTSQIAFVVAIFCIIINTYTPIFCATQNTSSTSTTTKATPKSSTTSVTTTTFPYTTTKSYKPPEACRYDISGPSEDVFILDRSESVNENNFNIAKDFVKSIIQRHFLLRENRHSIAVITFASRTKVEVDSITQGHVTECNLFAPGGPWDKISFDTTDKNGENMKEALESAWRLFATRDSQSMKRRLWIVSDYHGMEPRKTIVQDFPGVTLYGVGIGGYVEPLNFYTSLGEEDANATCRFRMLQDWRKIIESNFFVKPEEKRNLNLGRFVPVTGVENCTASQCEADEVCMCREFDPTAKLSCVDKENSTSVDDDDKFPLLHIILGAIGGCLLILIIIFIACCCCCRKKNSKESTTSTVTTDMSDVSTYTNNVTINSTAVVQTTTSLPHDDSAADSLYGNGTLGTLLMMHGVAVQSNGTPPYKEHNKNNIETVQNPVFHANTNARAEVPNSSGSGTDDADRNLIRNIMYDLDDNANGRFKKNPNLREKTGLHLPVPRPESGVSEISHHTYVEPVWNAGKYENVNDGQHSPVSTHSYEPFQYPVGEKNDTSVGGTSNDLQSELQKKLQKMRNRISGAFQRKANKGEKVADEERPVEVVQRYPRRVPATPEYQLNKEANPTYIDPGTNTKMASPPFKPIKRTNDNKTENPERKSSKFGTNKFKKLQLIFSGTEYAQANRPGRTEPGPNGPYSIVDQTSFKTKPSKSDTDQKVQTNEKDYVNVQPRNPNPAKSIFKNVL